MNLDLWNIQLLHLKEELFILITGINSCLSPPTKMKRKKTLLIAGLQSLGPLSLKKNLFLNKGEFCCLLIFFWLTSQVLLFDVHDKCNFGQ